ncbi:cupin domain-containing protein [Limnothrix sp. FACHB-1083]|uniref:cupin domain-containing protein n=1 Tax=unclassified Limnothrix TaxID=2632864 RepID=UPI00167FF7B9|nr:MULTISPECIES: cupin domain-containing protein [unclassified Limnothrix]MBD2160385.1 cupin domain-containing protein [Limnothrix sp. FACHB-1083]MBD2191086.1 cupin domain-containing protein [Limnothrix sp. FACHB-1088]
MKRVALSEVPIERVSHNPAIAKQVLLRQGDLPHLTNFSRACFAPGQVSPGHAHSDMHEVFFIEAGQGTMIIDGQRFDLVPGVCLAIAPHEVHEIANTGPEELVITYFGLRAIGD